MTPFERAPGTAPLLYAHRGGRGAPENSLRAFERGMAAGADGVELDVRTCGTGEVVVFHDADLQRLAADPRRIGELSWSELCAIRVQGEPIPRLDAALDLVLGVDGLVNVELKHDTPSAPHLARALAAVLDALPAAGRRRVLVSSFSVRLLWFFRRCCPDVPSCFLFEPARLGMLRARVAAMSVDLAGLHPRADMATAARITRLKARGLVNLWTVNDGNEARKFASWGVDGVVVDEVAAVRAALG